jgi:hypothetical protein
MYCLLSQAVFQIVLDAVKFFSISRRHGCRESRDELDLEWTKSESATHLVRSKLAGLGLGDDFSAKVRPSNLHGQSKLHVV